MKIGSTQANESFNHMVACKNPKSRFYAGSESTAFRVAVAVAQKNIGQETLSKVCKWFLKMQKKREKAVFEWICIPGLYILLYTKLFE